jgi:IstB-like ATP binding protein
LRERIRFLCRTSLLIVDEIGYLPVIPGGGNLFFQLVNARYEKGAMILTSNRGFAEWGEVFGDPVVAIALLDRLLHHAVVIQIEGASYRLRQHTDLMPEHVRSKASINAPIPVQPPRSPTKEWSKRSPSRLIIGTRQLGNFTPAQMGKIDSALTGGYCDPPICLTPISTGCGRRRLPGPARESCGPIVEPVGPTDRRTSGLHDVAACAWGSGERSAILAERTDNP